MFAALGEISASPRCLPDTQRTGSEGDFAGLKPEDVTIDITGEMLTIKGETKAEQEIKKEDYLYQERLRRFFPNRDPSHRAKTEKAKRPWRTAF